MGKKSNDRQLNVSLIVKQILPVGTSLLSRHSFGERKLRIFLAKITAVVFDFDGNGRLGRERSFHRGDESVTVKNKEEVGGDHFPPPASTVDSL